MPSYHNMDVEAELSVLTALTADMALSKPKKQFKRRDSEMDPLLLAATLSSGPNVTRNHYAHDLFPGVGDPRAPGAWDWTKWTGTDPSSKLDREKASYVSQQAPRRQRLRAMGISVEEDDERLGLTPHSAVKSQLGSDSGSERLAPGILNGVGSELNGTHERPGLPPSAELTVKCMARTRIPTPHGPAFLHLYHNNRDNKEHMAIVVDSAQFSEETTSDVPHIRSSSLDSVWSPQETAMDRITRGAYAGRLSPTVGQPSAPPTDATPSGSKDIAAPLVRIHSECFTGETIGSMRCDCGEQLDEAIRLISQPITTTTTPSRTIPGRGAVVYLRQEGRGIGLLSKIRAYNLQDMGHDTVTANLMLGHKADERGYEIAAAILKDLGMVDGEGVRLLTNNPLKVSALEEEGVRIAERVPMVPRSWRSKSSHDHAHDQDHDAGVTLVGSGAFVHGQDLDKYLRTKVLRMGHMIPLYNGEEEGLAVGYE